MPEPYRHYNPPVIDRVVLHPGVLVVLPESQHPIAFHLAPAQIAVWWLSVDNALASGGPLSGDFFQLPILHVTQSMYAAAWLRRQGRHDLWPLGDFTDSSFLDAQTTLATPRTRSVLFNPNKGLELAQTFNRSGSPFPMAPIFGMSKRQTRDLMRSSRYYIDFGHHPGKDRMPREAAVSGCIVLVRKLGAARFFDDVPLDDVYKFDDSAVQDGSLAKRLARIDANYEQHWQAQARYRSWIAQEREIFKAQVNACFPRPPVNKGMT